MRKAFLLVAVVAGLAAGIAPAAGVVVLTEEPVAEFALPDGSILKNAYVWKRTFEGLMIIHDDGQFFLNFKTLPDDWRRAYGIDESVEQVPMAITKRYDQYSLYPILERIQMPRTTITFLESERYNGRADEYLLLACALQAMLDGNDTAARRLNGVVASHFTNAVALELDSFYAGCEACSSNGVFTSVCRKCNGDGRCAKCGGAGRVESEFDKDKDKTSAKKKGTSKEKEKDGFSPASSDFDDPDSMHCTNCRGSGKCLACKGSGKRSTACMNCKGKGRVLDIAAAREALAVNIKVLNNVRDGIPPPKPAKEETAAE